MKILFSKSREFELEYGHKKKRALFRNALTEKQTYKT